MSARLWSGLIAVGALSLAAVPSHAATPLPAGWYIQGGAGANQPRDVDINVGGFEREAKYNTGWIGSGAVGYGWQNGLRLEIEGAYRSNGVDSLAGGPAAGSVKATNVMTNLIYQYPTTGWVIPYLGFGVGAGRAKLDSVGLLGAAPGTTVNDSDWSPAYQLLVGMEYPVTDNLGLDLSYRFMYEPQIKMHASNGAGVDMTYQTHAIMVGLRWSFGAPKPVMAEAPKPMPQMAEPAPAPKPAPPPQAAKPMGPSQFLVFFDWDSAILTDEAKKIVHEAAAAVKAGKITRIEVTGHADRSGPASYNMHLSQRRAYAVEAELVRNGVQSREIAVFAKGETQPLVPTADGVREPQNRRVQIVFPGQGRAGS